MKLSNDVLNKHIDGELTAAESDEVKRILTSSPEDHKNYVALLSVHQNLKKLNELELADSFTSSLMEKIGALGKRKSDRFFIIIMSSLFLIVSLLILSFVGYQVITSVDTGGSFSLYDRGAEGINFVIEKLKDFKESAGFSIIGAVFAFSILVSGYFFFERQKNIADLKN